MGSVIKAPQAWRKKKHHQALCADASPASATSDLLEGPSTGGALHGISRNKCARYIWYCLSAGYLRKHCHEDCYS